MKNKFIFSLVTILLLCFTSCSIEDNENFEFVALPITSVEMPERFVLNETYEIKVKYNLESDCTYFEGFDFVKEETTVRNVAVIASTIVDSEDCKEITKEIETSFNFIVLYEDTYLFKFYTGDDEEGEPKYLEIEVPVEVE